MIKYSEIVKYCNHLNFKVSEGIFKELFTILTKYQIRENQL